MDVAEIARIANGLSAEERSLLLDLPDVWHQHIGAAYIISAGRLGSLGLVSFIDSYEGPQAKRTDLGRAVAALIPDA